MTLAFILLSQSYTVVNDDRRYLWGDFLAPGPTALLSSLSAVRFTIFHEQCSSLVSGPTGRRRKGIQHTMPYPAPATQSMAKSRLPQRFYIPQLLPISSSPVRPGGGGQSIALAAVCAAASIWSWEEARWTRRLPNKSRFARSASPKRISSRSHKSRVRVPFNICRKACQLSTRELHVDGWSENARGGEPSSQRATLRAVILHSDEAAGGVGPRDGRLKRLKADDRRDVPRRGCGGGPRLRRRCGAQLIEQRLVLRDPRRSCTWIAGLVIGRR